MRIWPFGFAGLLGLALVAPAVLAQGVRAGGDLPPPDWRTKVKSNATTTVDVTLSCAPVPADDSAKGVNASFSCTILFLDAAANIVGTATAGASTAGTSASASTSTPTPAGTTDVQILCSGQVSIWGTASPLNSTR